MVKMISKSYKYVVETLFVLNFSKIIKTNVSEVNVQDSSKVDISGLNISCSIEKSITLQLRTLKFIIQRCISHSHYSYTPQAQ